MLILTPDERFTLENCRTMILNKKEPDPFALKQALEILIRAARERRQVQGKTTRSSSKGPSLQDLLDM